MELQSPPRTVRRNPPRKAKPTPASRPPPKSQPPNINDFPRFPLLDLQSDAQFQPKPHQKPTPKLSHDSASDDRNLQVFIRIRPLKTARPKKNRVDGTFRSKSTSMEKRICLVANDSQSVTLTTPQRLLDSKRTKTEVYDGFSHVFLSNAAQMEVYRKVMHPLVMDFIGGKSQLLVAMGPTGSGKTHTMFGSSREPGLVLLALRHLFLPDENNPSGVCRSYYVSMFEIYSERGRGERMLDLSQEGGDLSLQQSTIKGLQEVKVSSIADAESLLARGMSRRATAMTNANTYSSRSQCIINIRRAPEMTAIEGDILSNNAVLTVADLAGAEREKRTGNQGARLLESSFINNTSMVFGLCLRSLLEHQKNPKKPLQKHFQNSLLTRYLRDYLEAKKWMTLILTVSPGEDDYLDTSFVLRQASPYMKIMFSNNEELPNIPCQKRQLGALMRPEQTKRRKCNDPEIPVNSQGNSAEDGHMVPEEGQSQEHEEPVQVLSSFSLPDSVQEHEIAMLNAELKRRDRIELVMQGFSKALWNVLKEYKHKLEVSENEVKCLKENLKTENICTLELEKEKENLKACCLCCKQPSRDAPSNHVEDTSTDFCATSLSHLVGHIEANDDAACKEKKTPTTVAVNSSAVNACSPCLEASDSIHNLNSCDISTAPIVEIPFLVAIPETGVEDASLFSGDIKGQSDKSTGEEIEGFLVTKHDSERQSDLEVKGISSNEDMSETACKCSEALSVSPRILEGAADCIFPSSNRNTLVVEESAEQAVAIAGRGLLQGSINHASEVSGEKIDTIENEIQDSGKESSHLRPTVIETECHAKQVVVTEKHDSPIISLNPKKPRRRLLPASSMLLKEIDNFDMEDEVQKGGRGGRQKISAEERRRTQGSISLVRLLRENHAVK